MRVGYIFLKAANMQFYVSNIGVVIALLQIYIAFITLFNLSMRTLMNLQQPHVLRAFVPSRLLYTVGVLGCVCAAVALMSLPATEVQAQDRGASNSATSVEAMKLTLDDHFDGKSTRDIIYISAAGSGIPIGLVRMLAFDDDFSKGVGWGFIANGVVSGVLGVLTYVGSSEKHARANQLLADDPALYRALELERMDAVDSMYKTLLVFDTLLGAAGLGAYFYGLSQERGFVEGVGASTAFHGGVMLGLDLWRYFSAGSYEEAVGNFQPTAPATSLHLNLERREEQPDWMREAQALPPGMVFVGGRF